MPSAEVIPMEEHRQQIEFDAAVKEGKEIVARREKDQWRLGEIAANLKPIYGEATLEKFAEEIGFDYNTIWTYRQTFLDWQGIQKPPRGGFYAIARELNKHPDRAKIVAERPNITRREATAEMQRYHEQKMAAKAQPVQPPVPTPTEVIVKALGKPLTSQLPEFSQPTTPQEEFWQAGIKMIEGTTCMEKAQEKELATKAHSLTPLEIEQARWRDSFMFRAYESAHSAEYGDWSAYKVDQEMLDMAKKASEKWTAVYNYLKELAK